MNTSIGVIRQKRNRVRPALTFQFDYWLLLIVAALVVLGMLIVFSATFDLGLRLEQDSAYYLRRQSAALLLGLFCGFIVMQVDYRFLRKVSVPFLAFTLLLLIALLFAGETLLGARRGLYEGSYQPSEIAKLATILYIAHWVSSKGDRIRNVTYGLLPFGIITGAICGLIVLQPDLSTAALIAFVSLTIFFVAGAEIKQFVVAGLVSGGTAAALIQTLPHASKRIAEFQTSWRNPAEASYHVQHALYSLYSGGWFGVGLGEGGQKFGPLPAAHTDGVFAVLGQELGFAGCLLVIFLFCFLMWRGFRIARQARSSFGALLALGITCWLGYQALINLAVMTAVIPFTGIPLPFMSYGGSSLTFSLIGVSILLNISRDNALTNDRRGSRPQPISEMESLRESFTMRRRDGRSHLSGSGRRR